MLATRMWQHCIKYFMLNRVAKKVMLNRAFPFCPYRMNLLARNPCELRVEQIRSIRDVKKKKKILLS
jgi:hypothetical protein